MYNSLFDVQIPCNAILPITILVVIRSCLSFPQGENWDGLRALVSADTAFNEREEVLMILDKVHNPARRESLLKFLNGGKAFRYMQQHILPLLRNAMICIVWIKGV